MHPNCAEAVACVDNAQSIGHHVAWAVMKNVEETIPHALTNRFYSLFFLGRSDICW